MRSLWKPWYVYRPSQVVRRCWNSLRPSPQSQMTVKLPWGVSFQVDPRETIGHSIWTTGLYELPITELLFRLLKPGDQAIDAGANIGYITCIMAYLTGASGHVDAFEPHPELVQHLKRNIELLGNTSETVHVHKVGLSAQAGEAFLDLGSEFEKNNGTSKVAFDNDAGNSIRVLLQTLDETIGDRQIEVLKLDVEGHEAEALLGAEKSLKGKQIRHIIFENHEGPESRPAKMLTSAGYTVVEIGWQMNGIVLGKPNATSLAKSYEAPNYLATIDLPAIEAAIVRRGWACLNLGSANGRIQAKGSQDT